MRRTAIAGMLVVTALAVAPSLSRARAVLGQKRPARALAWARIPPPVPT